MSVLKTALAAASILLSTQAHAATQTITFEGLSNGSAVTTIGNTTFSGNNTVRVFDFGGTYAHSGVNTIADTRSFNQDLFVSFASVVSGLSFYSGGDDRVGVQAQIRVFVNGLFSSFVNLVGDGNVRTTDLQDLSAFSNVSRIEIFNVTDPSGLVYDDFTSTSGVAPVPLPASALLLVAALGGLGAFKRRKRA